MRDEVSSEEEDIPDILDKVPTQGDRSEIAACQEIVSSQPDSEFKKEKKNKKKKRLTKCVYTMREVESYNNTLQAPSIITIKLVRSIYT